MSASRKHLEPRLRNGVAVLLAACQRHDPVLSAPYYQRRCRESANKVGHGLVEHVRFEGDPARHLTVDFPLLELIDGRFIGIEIDIPLLVDEPGLDVIDCAYQELVEDFALGWLNFRVPRHPPPPGCGSGH